MTIRLDAHLPDFHRGAPPQLPVRLAATANVTIATGLNAGDTIDGKTLAAGDRILLPVQSTGSQNGVYIAGVTPARSFDMAEGVAAWGSVIYVIDGTANGGKLFVNTNLTLPTIDTTALTFTSLSLGSIAASLVSVLDSAGFFTGTNVETVLAELASKDIGYTAHGNTGSTETFDALTGWHSATLNAATVTFTFTGATSGLVAAMVLELAQDGTGGRLVTWPGSVVWPGGVAPTLSTAPAAVDILTFFSRDGGTTWYGFLAGGGGSALTIKEEGTPLATAATSIDFVGAGVTATGSGAAKTVTMLRDEPHVDYTGSVVLDGNGDPVMVLVA